MQRPTKWFWCYAGIAIADLLFVISGNVSNRLISKPLLLPMLMIVWYSSSALQGKTAITFFAALFFSWVGDILLMFDGKADLFFIGGLSSFLLAHIFYILFFLQVSGRKLNNRRKSNYIGYVFPVAAYILFFLFMLWPGLGSLKIPVVVYALTIGTMLVCALRIQNRNGLPEAKLILAGAVLFVISDSLLAWNKFRDPFPLASFWIMLTYIIAQALLTRGAIATQPHSHPAAIR